MTATPKTPPNPLLAPPDGKPLKSAWLTRLHAAAEAAAAQALEMSRYNPGRDRFLPTHTAQANHDFIGAVPHTAWQGGHALPALACLAQWHGDAALPFLALHLDARRSSHKDMARLIASLNSAAALDTLLPHLALPEVRDAVADFAGRWPVHTLRALLALDPRRGQPAADLLQRLLHQHPDWLPALQTTLQTSGDEAQTRTLARLLAPTETVTEARADALPAMLREPPWRKGGKASTLPVLPLTPRPTEATADWTRWQGGTVEPRPRTRLSSIVLAVGFHDAPHTLLDFLGAHDLVPANQLQAMRDRVRASAIDTLGYYATPGDNFILEDMHAPGQNFQTLHRFLQSSGRLAAHELQALLRWDDIDHCEVHPCWLTFRRQYFQVEAEFEGLLGHMAEGSNQWAGKALPARAAELHALADAGWGPAGRALYLLGAKPERVAPVLASDTLSADDLGEPCGHPRHRLSHLGHLSDALALAVLRIQKLALPADHWDDVDQDTCRSPAARLLKRFGPAHIDLILPTLPPLHQGDAQHVTDIIDSDHLALHLSEKGFASRLLRPYARRWLLARPHTAARALMAPAFSADAKAAAHARFHLFALAKEGHANALRTEAAACGPEAEAAVAQLLATPPENLLPAQVPKLPAWLNIPRLPRLLLAGSGHAVPLAHMPDALMPLALAKGGMAYAGLDVLQQATTPDSLARVMLGLFEQWVEHDMPAKDRWIFELQGRLGDDATARALAPRIREWRSHLDRVRAYEGLEMLTHIGSDTALMLLASFTEQKRYTDLADRAAKALTRVADERGLTREELADRTVPTLGLDERSRMALDFGPRQFSASLSNDLTPQVFDEGGARLKDLPKPGAKDDAALAKAASSEWKELKKQAKLVAQTQIACLESAMCAQRRWQAGDFMHFFAQHPVLRGLSQRLVWAVFDTQDQWQTGFRVAEDATLADVHDTTFTPPPDARIGLPHPLEMPEDARRAWSQVLADYELLQVFEQLARATHALQPDEATKDHLPRYAGRQVGTGSLLGLEARGWRRGAGDGGMLDHFTKPLGHGLSATLGLAEGWFIAGPPPASSESHELTGLRLSCTESTTTNHPTWADVPPIALSEMLRDLEKMAWHAAR
ncbi:MAG: DUF4132 domain-containing protein [Pseudomonadota bacterium]|nr:DUF4132 domain-containing protein [Pseudomonadota bacterium]